LLRRLRGSRRDLEGWPHVVAHHHERIGRHSWLRHCSGRWDARLSRSGSRVVVGALLLLLGSGRSLQNVEATRGTRLLPLEPRAEARRVEDVVARQLLRG